MFINNVTLKNFRNYSDIYFELSPGYNFFTGDNGSGKTNILEALSVLSNTKSFRNAHDEDIIKWGEKYYYCSANISDEINNKFEVGFILNNDKNKKKVKIDGVEIRKATDYFGKLLTVIIAPDDIQIFGGIPEYRRRYFDAIITRTDPEYYTTLRKYRKTLISRNLVIKEIKEKRKNDFEKHLNAWDEVISISASEIIKKRLHFIETFNLYFSRSYENISGGEYMPIIKYNNSFQVEGGDEIKRKLKERTMKDILAGSTTIGPQRDDYSFESDTGVDFKRFASQGQKRTASIAIKNAELIFVEEKLKKKAVIIIDDIFSELDAKRKKRLLSFLEGGNQVVFTMANKFEHTLNDNILVKKYNIDNGIITRI